MRHQIPGLHSRHQDSEASFDVFSGACERAWYRRHPQRTIRGTPICYFGATVVPSTVLFQAGLLTERALWKLQLVSSRLCLHLPTCSIAIKSMQKALLNLRGSFVARTRL